MHFSNLKIKDLISQVKEAALSEKNQKRFARWDMQSDSVFDHWRGVPATREQNGIIPFEIEPEIPLWGNILGFSVVEFYTDPRVYLENTLKMKLYRHEHFDEDTVVDLSVDIWLGTTLESSLFGLKTILVENQSPWLGRELLVTTEKDLAKLTQPDFYKSGLMPTAHRFYNEIKNLVGDELQVSFPGWDRNPFGVAFHLMKIENLLMGMLDNPAFIHKLLRLITDSCKEWTKQKAKFLGQPVGMGSLFSDEVNIPTLSPALYEEFVFPYECELSEFYGGISYWHSCGNTTDLMKVIRRIPNIHMFHVGPWTSLNEAVKVFKGIPLEICLNPLSDIHMADEKSMESKLREIIETCPPKQPLVVRADGMHLIKSLDYELLQIKQFNRIACLVLRGELV